MCSDTAGIAHGVMVVDGHKIASEVMQLTTSMMCDEMGPESTTATEYGPVQNVVLHAAKTNMLNDKTKHEQATRSKGTRLRDLWKNDTQLGDMCRGLATVSQSLSCLLEHNMLFCSQSPVSLHCLCLFASCLHQTYYILRSCLWELLRPSGLTLRLQTSESWPRSTATASSGTRISLFIIMLSRPAVDSK